tara:strand:- start:479 stop:1663 length:1185 start_codon:yes stop_codon:yes gene_type:complete
MPFAEPSDLDLSNVTGLYVHIPFCEVRCPYCAFYVTTRDRDHVGAFLDALEFELAAYPALDLRTIYFGGGTPSMLSVGQLQRLCAIVRDGVRGDTVEECSIEINPGTLDLDKCAVLRDAGVTRCSIGAQSFDDDILKRLGRTHNAREIEQTVGLAREAGITNINLDLIACIPGVTPEQWQTTVGQAIACKTDHMSIYALDLDEGSALTEQADAGRFALLDDDEQLAMLSVARTSLETAGFEAYEISNFAREGFRCQHHVDCWQGGEYIGIGPSAASHVGPLRWRNAPDLKAYINAAGRAQSPPREIDERSPDIVAAERLVFGLRMSDGVPASGPALAGVLHSLAEDGLLAQVDSRWKMTERGRALADHVARELFTAATNNNGTKEVCHAIHASS